MSRLLIILLFLPIGMASCTKHVGEATPAILEQISQMSVDTALANFGGDIDKNIEIARRANDYAVQHLGPEHPRVAGTLNDIAVLLSRKDPDNPLLEPLFQQALGILEKNPNSDDSALGTILNNLAVFYLHKGDLARAEPIFLRSLAIQEKLNSEDPSVVLPLLNLTRLYRALGDNARADQMLERFNILFERHAKNKEWFEDLFLQLGRKELVSMLIRIGVTHWSQGDYAGAEIPMQIALAIQQEVSDPKEALVTGELLLNLSNIYMEKGDDQQAEDFLNRAIAIQDENINFSDRESTEFHVTALQNQGVLYMVRGDIKRAEFMLNLSLSVTQKFLGPEHLSAGSALAALGVINQSKGNYSYAETLYQRSLGIFENKLDPNHPWIAGILGSLGMVYWASGDVEKAIAFMTRGRSIDEYLDHLVITKGTEKQKSANMEVRSRIGSADSTLSLHLKGAPRNISAARLALVSLLKRKGRVLDAVSESTHILRQQLTPDIQMLFDQLMSKRTQISNLHNRGFCNRSADQDQTQLKQLETEVDKIENQLNERSVEFRILNKPVTLEHLQTAIPEGSALVELALFRPFNPKIQFVERWDSEHYAAYVLFSNGDLRWKDLGEAQTIDEAVDALQVALHNPNSKFWSNSPRGDLVPIRPETQITINPARALDELIMQPIRKLLGDTHKVFLSPDGNLNLIPFGALVDQKGHYLIENYHFTYLTSGRDLLRLQVKSETNGSALVLADPDFESTFDGSQEIPLASRGRRSADLSRYSLQFDPLPGTAEEAMAIAQLLGVQPQTGISATESILKQIHRPSILHIATHGFFLPDQPQEPNTKKINLLCQNQALAIPHTENPLLRSGLALAGANRLQSGPEDGLFTALEASGLDLWGTQLVALSACKTGVGTVKTGEGVYGLRRAFVIAGAETLVMSLWKVDDAATRDLMVDYYGRLIKGEERSEALRQAQLTMLHSKNRNDPYYWASFIVSGDWRALQDKSTEVPNH